MCTRGWRETDSETDWDFFWAEREWVYEAFDSTHLESWQRINHFRNGRELCRKDLLLKNLKRRKRQLEREGHHTEATAYEFFPVSFVLPREYAMFVEEFKRSGGVWIMKVRPPARARSGDASGAAAAAAAAPLPSHPLLPLPSRAARPRDAAYFSSRGCRRSAIGRRTTACGPTTKRSAKSPRRT